MLSTEQLKTTSNLQKLTHFWQEQADVNLRQIVAMRNCSLSAGDIELMRQTKTSLRTHPIMVEIIQKGNKCDVLLEIWCIQVINKNYVSETELLRNQNNTGRFRLNKNAFWWIGRILPCWSENISNIKKGENQKLFETKLRICDRNGRETPKLGIYECSVDQCPDCKDRGRKCTPSSKGLHPAISTHNTELSDYFRNYSTNSNGEINYMRVGELKGETGHYRVEVVYFNDKVHNEMTAAATTKVTFMNSPRSNNIGIINDYSPDMNRPRATITHSPPSRTSPLPVSHNNLKPMIYSDHGKSAPVNINEQGSQNSLSKEANSQQKYSFSFDKDIIELLATSPQSSISQQDNNNAPLWKKLDRNEDEAPVSPLKFEKRRSGRRKSSSGKSSVMSSGDESQFAFDSETPKKSEERPILFDHDPDFDNF